jgi:uncharacterized membrane protein
MFVFVSQSVYAMEKFECFGTEPFWDASLLSNRVIVRFDEKTTTYEKPKYTPASGTGSDYVTSVIARTKLSTFIAFIVNQNAMHVADKDGKSTAENTKYRSYCSDGMSDRAYPYSVHLIVDGMAYTGCCSTLSNPAVGEN